MNSDDDTTLPALQWRLRVSPRARYARLQIRPYGGLEVVIPPRFPRREVPYLVDQHADWARRQLERQARLRAAVRMPHRLELALQQVSIPVVYRDRQLCFDYGDNDGGGEAPIQIESQTEAGQRRELRAWVRARAHELLPPLLAKLSARTGLEYRKLGIRSQKTRWGSCSRRAHISLNDQLLFVPAGTVEYLMIHELCHTRHLNHSADFWRLVEHHCPDYRRHEKLLGQSRSLVPDWYLLDLYG